MPTLSAQPAISPEAAATTPIEEQNVVTTPTKVPLWETLQKLPGQAIMWDRFTVIGFLSLFGLWAGLFYWTWGTWGSVTIDSGREMYAAFVLSKGRVLYQDVVYQYPPLAPYFNALLFRVFGIHLEVLYWTGSLSALASAFLLYATGSKLSFRIAGWTAGAVLLIEAFRRALFSFPLPYSYSSVYGCLISCLFLWLLATNKPSLLAWRLAMGSAAAAVLLLKIEFGVACYAALGLFIVADCMRARSRIGGWSLAIAPGMAVCLGVAAWMVSIRGADFITHENMDSWPTSYFMKTYGKMWLKASGFDLSARSIRMAAIQLLVLAGILAGLRWILRRMEGSERRLVLWILLMCVLVVFTLGFPLPTIAIFHGIIFFPAGIFDLIAFPPAMAVLVGAAALTACWLFLRRGPQHSNPAVIVIPALAALLPARSLMQNESYGYSVYNNGPEILCFLILGSLFIAPLSSSKRRQLLGSSLVCVACLTSVIANSNISNPAFKSFVSLKTDRGMVLLPKAKAENYEVAIAFMKQQAALGNSVMSIPEDTSLYFFSNMESPTRVQGFVPGVVAPGKMTDEVISELEKNRPKFLVWSNREYPEYGVPKFGTDFDVPIGDYLRAHYRPVGALGPVDANQWNAVIWERAPAALLN